MDTDRPEIGFSAARIFPDAEPVDDQDVWSVSCFFIDKKFRRQGLSLELLNAAIDWAKIQGASLVEGYPIDTPKEK